MAWIIALRSGIVFCVGMAGTVLPLLSWASAQFLGEVVHHAEANLNLPLGKWPAFGRIHATQVGRDRLALTGGSLYGR